MTRSEKATCTVTLEGSCWRIRFGLVLKDPIEKLNEVASQKIRYAVQKARNLIWALTIQALFNDPKLSDLLDQFGTGLKKETAFREYLRKLASSRLLPILKKEGLAKPEHAERMANERYDFLSNERDLQPVQRRWLRQIPGRSKKSL